MTRLCLILTIFSLTVISAFSQIDSNIIANKFPIDDDINYKGGNDRINKILIKNLHYPQSAIKDSVEGTVYVYFTIETDGQSTELKIMKGIRTDLDNEAMRCVDLLNDWIPGKNNGMKMKLHHILPIKFSLTSLKNK